MTIECFGNWSKCPKERMQKINEDGSMYYEIICSEKDNCYLKWKESCKEVIMNNDIEKLIKYPKIFSLGSPETEGILDGVVVCESKIDGAQFRAKYLPEENRLIFGSRNNLLPENTNPDSWKAIRSYKKQFELFKDKFIPDIIYYSESMQKHTFEYINIPDTIGYDVFDVKRQEFYDWKDAKIAFEQIGIPFINVHFEKPGKDVTIDELKNLIKTSPYRKGGDEGIVLKHYTRKNMFGRPLFAKIVDDSFKEENRKVFGSPTSPATHDEFEIIDRYLNDVRFEKAIIHLKEQSESIEMSLMPKLFKYLGDDILSENILYISGEWKSIDFKTFYNSIAKRCARMLQEYILKNTKSE